MNWRLVAELADGPRRFELSNGEYTVGADQRCAIHLPEPTVSRRHARLVVKGMSLQVEDLGSRNGTWLGRRRIESRERLAAGATLVFGTITARLEAVADEDAEAALLFELSGHLPIVEQETVETAGVSLLEIFTLDRLPKLLDAATHGGDERLAQLLEEHLDQLVPSGWLLAPDGERIGRRRIRLREGGGSTIAQPVVACLTGLWRLAERLERPPARPPSSEPPPPPLPEPITRDQGVQQLYRDAARVARGEISVLIVGETGTGKEVLARWLHNASPRRDGPFLALNCAALPAELLEAELFGVEKGVATGVDERPGKLELAAGGSLFLDEIGDAPKGLQAKLLRVLQERTLYRLGASRPTTIDVRLIAATHRDPEHQLIGGDLRLDLYHRLADWIARVPPLRRRGADIPALAAHFLRAAARRLRRPVRGISHGALDALCAYSWPGNIRELRQEMERAALLLGPGELLDRPRLSPHIPGAEPGAPLRRLENALRTAEKHHIHRVLSAEEGDRGRAARRLGISQATLYRRLGDLDLG